MRYLRVACLALLVIAFELIPAAPGFAFNCLLSEFDVQIHADRTQGVIPLEVFFFLEAIGEPDTIEEALWDFDGDGTHDASGVQVSHTFPDALDYTVSVTVTTGSHGTLVRQMEISAYRALMSLTFDDGHISVYTDALPLVEDKGVTATAYIVPTWIGGYWYMEWWHVQELQAAGWDIGSHSMTHADLTQVDQATLDYELSQSRWELESRGFPADHFAVPYGAYDDTVLTAVGTYYESNRVVDGLNGRVEETDPYLIRSSTSLSFKGFNYYRTLIDSAIADTGWYVMANHAVVQSCYDAVFCIDTQLLSDVIDYALDHRVLILNVEEALNPGDSGFAGVDAESRREDPAIRLHSPATVISGGDGIRISYEVLRPLNLEIGVYDTQGRLVSSLGRAHKAPGKHVYAWDGCNRYGSPVASGAYFVLLRPACSRPHTLRVIVAR
jgi:PKD repeat protein